MGENLAGIKDHSNNQYVWMSFLTCVQDIPDARFPTNLGVHVYTIDCIFLLPVVYDPLLYLVGSVDHLP